MFLKIFVKNDKKPLKFAVLCGIMYHKIMTIKNDGGYMKNIGLNNNQLKMIGMAVMLLDHAGIILFPQCEILRIIGRLGFPIFAYMISEGCLYTRNRRRYLVTLLSMAIVIQAVYFIAMRSLYQNILVTFSLSVMTVFAIDAFIKNKNVKYGVIMWVTLSVVVFLSVIAPLLFKDHGFVIDYGFFGVLLPVAVYYARGKICKLASVALILVIRGLLYGELKWFALLSLPLLFLYNGERGKAGMKYVFYIFYPVHLVILYGISFLI